MADEAIPGEPQASAAKWLSERTDGETLMNVANNGGTPLFWYVASLLAEYKEKS